MHIGFDYGTANCSVANMDNGQPSLIPLENGRPYLPSTLCAPTRESVTEYLYRFMGVTPTDVLGEQMLRQAINANRDEDIELKKGDLRFGQAALDWYLGDPEDVYYIKSPKSFLGASGLRDGQVRFFEDLVCAMMANIKQTAEVELNQDITAAMIGRPINFQGIGGDKANQQAESILRNAAARAGFRHVEFQFEPVAAGLEFESTLTKNTLVLVVDIGGGTTDCSLLEMGPDWINQTDRTASLLAHSGERVGGNDLDIHLAFRQVMPLLGFGSKTTKGIDLPLSQFWNPIAINNVAAQTDFYSVANRAALNQLRMDAAETDKVAHLLKVYRDTLGHHLVRQAEEGKMALSEQTQHRAMLDILEEGLFVDMTQSDLELAIDAPMKKIEQLVQDVMAQSGRLPDVIYMTGGSARSPLLKASVERAMPNVPIVSGSYFGSVTSGLARWADRIFK